MRLDQHISTKLELSRNRAQFLIDEKLVKVNSKIITKASFQVNEGDIVEVTEDKKIEYVARSAIKLELFLEELDFDITGFKCLDAGASTGGFTQILLNKGASRVQTIDVGTSQLHDKIKLDSRVNCIENMDIRNYKTTDNYDLIVADLSFISLHKIIESLKGLSSKNTSLILLFKPQFEVGRDNLKKSGVPKDDKIVIRSLDKFKLACKTMGFRVSKIEESKLKGEAGNREFFIFMKLADIS
ncbi:MAG: TlyA family RNA methyltransferase [Candidatus Gracilibacteria bacterium]|nr:TlyA family RNA methyltransferase [Candidatus Gracilibacteria bacterium]